MFDQFEQKVSRTLDEIKSQGLYKTERIITSPQDAKIEIAGGQRVLNMCANNYLGLADHPALIAAAKEALDTHGFGMASVRFICGTQDIHKELEAQLTAAKDARFRLIATDGCFSMDGTIANLKVICELAEKRDALTMIDDAHATGFLGKTGRGTHECCGVMGKIDILTGTLGKALGGASGGFTSGRKQIVDLLRQRSRPYLFSNSVAPHIVAATLKTLELLSASTELRDKLEKNTNYFRAALTERGLSIKPGIHPIVPIMIGDAAKSQKFAARMLEKGVYVIGFFFPVVPHGKARIRTQVSAAHSREDLEFAVNAFAEVNQELKEA